MKVSELLVPGDEAEPISEAQRGFKPGDSLDDVEEVLDAFIEYAIDSGRSDDAHDMEDPDDGTDYLVRQMEMWLDHDGYGEDEVEEFMEENQDAIHEHIYGGLT